MLRDHYNAGGVQMLVERQEIFVGEDAATERGRMISYNADGEERAVGKYVTTSYSTIQIHFRQ